MMEALVKTRDFNLDTSHNDVEVFEALGLSLQVMDWYFAVTLSRVGVTFEVFIGDILHLFELAFLAQDFPC